MLQGQADCKYALPKPHTQYGPCYFSPNAIMLRQYQGAVQNPTIESRGKLI